MHLRMYDTFPFCISFDGWQEDEKRLISVDTTEASASLPMQDVYENGEWKYFVPIYRLKHMGLVGNEL